MPVTLNYVVVDVATGEPVEGLAVYTWHCDRHGSYSMYSQSTADENYSGRWPHDHFEVYPSVEQATATPPPAARSP